MMNVALNLCLPRTKQVAIGNRVGAKILVDKLAPGERNRHWRASPPAHRIGRDHLCASVLVDVQKDAAAPLRFRLLQRVTTSVAIRQNAGESPRKSPDPLENPGCH